jgi:1,4-dihydroxy-2-naphthoate octaprenyltransferase
LLALLAAPLAWRPSRLTLGGAKGRDLVPVLADTGRLQLAIGLLLVVGVSL